MTQPPQPDLDLGAISQIDEVTRLVRSVLGSGVVGVYLYGSAVEGGLRPGSDLDVFVVTGRPTTAADRRALVDGLLPISGPRAASGPARSIELTTVVQSDVRPWRYPPLLDFLYGDWLRAEFERGDLPSGPRPNPDLAVLITVILLGSRPLFGPPAAEVLDPVPSADLDRAMLEVIPALLGDLESDTGNVILTLARIWSTAATGQIRSKDAAADWLMARLPEEHRAVLARARAIYLGDEPDRWDDLSTCVSPHAEYVVQEIRALSRTSVVVSPERPDSRDATSLILELETHLEPLYPAASRHGFSIERLLAEDVDFFVLRSDGTPAACGGIHLVDGEYGEIKRMYVRPAFRGSGFGKRILDRLAGHARSHGVTLLRLETGIHQREAIRLYERTGFRRIPPFGPYTDDPLSLCYEKRLD